MKPGFWRIHMRARRLGWSVGRVPRQVLVEGAHGLGEGPLWLSAQVALLDVLADEDDQREVLQLGAQWLVPQRRTRPIRSRQKSRYATSRCAESERLLCFLWLSGGLRSEIRNRCPAPHRLGACAAGRLRRHPRRGDCVHREVLERAASARPPRNSMKARALRETDRRPRTHRTPTSTQLMGALPKWRGR